MLKLTNTLLPVAASTIEEVNSYSLIIMRKKELLIFFHSLHYPSDCYSLSFSFSFYLSLSLSFSLYLSISLFLLFLVCPRENYLGQINFSFVRGHRPLVHLARHIHWGHLTCVCVSVCVCVCVCVCCIACILYIRLCVELFYNTLYGHCIRSSVCLSIYLFVYLSVCLYVYLFIFDFVCSYSIGPFYIDRHGVRSSVCLSEAYIQCFTKYIAASTTPPTPLPHLSLKNNPR